MFVLKFDIEDQCTAVRQVHGRHGITVAVESDRSIFNTRTANIEVVQVSGFRDIKNKSK
jgi:hypothetical protein